MYCTPVHQSALPLCSYTVHQYTRALCHSAAVLYTSTPERFALCSCTVHQYTRALCTSAAVLYTSTPEHSSTLQLYRTLVHQYTGALFHSAAALYTSPPECSATLQLYCMHCTVLYCSPPHSAVPHRFLFGEVCISVQYSCAQDCLWNSKEHIVGDLSPPVQGNLH